MNERFRIYAAVGLAGVFVLAGGYLVLGRGASSSAAPAVHVIKPLHPHAKTKAKVALAPPKLAGKATVKRRPAVVGGVPTPLADALKHHSVVVVALVSPDSAVDRLTLAEAKAGATQAHAGFAAISVSRNAQVQALSTLVGASADPQNRLLDAPAVLVFQKPRTLYVRLNGYVDADTIGQAVVNAASVQPAS
ncbi:MAG TPA: hypothetical protein VF066_13765 [Thermoleophilaceae bacterium]